MKIIKPFWLRLLGEVLELVAKSRTLKKSIEPVSQLFSYGTANVALKMVQNGTHFLRPLDEVKERK